MVGSKFDKPLAKVLATFSRVCATNYTATFAYALLLLMLLLLLLLRLRELVLEEVGEVGRRRGRRSRATATVRCEGRCQCQCTMLGRIRIHVFGGMDRRRRAREHDRRSSCRASDVLGNGEDATDRRVYRGLGISAVRSITTHGLLWTFFDLAAGYIDSLPLSDVERYNSERYGEA